jgi:hypothetical protein
MIPRTLALLLSRIIKSADERLEKAAGRGMPMNRASSEVHQRAHLQQQMRADSEPRK